MAWLLFMDESGHDHKNMPFEVRGGVAVHAKDVWLLIQKIQAAEKEAFGVTLSEYGSEIKGSKLLSRDRFRWSSQMGLLSDIERAAGVRRFLTKKSQKAGPSRRDFTAYGQASLLMADLIFQALLDTDAVLFASLIACGVKPPRDYPFHHYLRKDHIFLQERFFYFLEQKADHGIFVMDQTEKENDKRFVKRLHDYYTKTHVGRQRTQWIVPYPMFVDSELSLAVQAADLCLYCINWGFRVQAWNFKGPARIEIQQKYGALLNRLQFQGEGYRDDKVFSTHGIVYVPDPFTSRDAEKI